MVLVLFTNVLEKSSDLYGIADPDLYRISSEKTCRSGLRESCRGNWISFPGSGPGSREMPVPDGDTRLMDYGSGISGNHGY